ncbi:MAG: CarD family transcriptional regulator [Oscillibacter sp.]|nr:CarD family transcriptional regulator [Oscillibacter sp.]
MFQIGDLVVHPMHGAGIIDDVVTEKIAGSTKEYYVFKMPVGGLILKIPVDSCHSVGIRSIISPAEAEAFFAGIPSLEVESNTNWSKRYQENLTRLKSGNLNEVARVVKGLMRRESRRGLSTGERKLLHSAKQIIISEIVLVEGGVYQDVEARLDRAVMQKLPVSQ